MALETRLRALAARAGSVTPLIALDSGGGEGVFEQQLNVLRYLGIPTISLPDAARARRGQRDCRRRRRRPLVGAAAARIARAEHGGAGAVVGGAAAPPPPRLVDAHAPPTTRLPANVNLSSPRGGELLLLAALRGGGAAGGG